MKKLLYIAIALVKIYGECEGMVYSNNERSVDFSAIKLSNIPSNFSSAQSGFIQGNIFIFTCAVDLDKLCNDLIEFLSDESQYSPDVNMLLRNEELLKEDTFPRSLSFLSQIFSAISIEKRNTISKLVEKVEDYIREQYAALNTEYSNFIKSEELLAVESFFFRRLEALQNFPR